MNKYSFIVSIAGIFLLTACSHSVPSARSTAATPAQTEQLANVPAASRFLHDSCQRTDIPGAEGRLNAALAQAKQRDWSLDDTRQKALSARADKDLGAVGSGRDAAGRKMCGV